MEPKFRRTFYLGLVALQPMSCICSKLFQAPKRYLLVPITHQKVCILLFAVTVFPAGSISEEEESFAPLFLLSIVSSYHSNNSMGYSKFYLGFLKEHERRTGRRERFEEVMREFYKWSSRAEMSYTSISYVKMLL